MPKADSAPASPNLSLDGSVCYDGMLGSNARNGKRLIVLCDGTWQDAESSPEKRKPPTNIIRMARAIKPETWITEEVEVPDKHGHKIEGKPLETVKRQIDQIVYYQSGVGTGVTDQLTGGSFGIGLSEKVRGAYAFLANNYVQGDRIFIFGFSRGAFTARAIAGLVSKMGLLDKRGMDNFPEVYKRYWKMPRSLSPEQEELQWAEARRDFGIEPPADGLIEAMGVFDTVGFHRPLTGRFAWLDRFLGEQYELRNTELPPQVRHAFQALSLDENRFAFKPTLWYLPKKLVNGVKRDTVLKQCWFSGEHSDCGGGKKDPRLSNVALGWMISELVERKLLDFDPEYLLEEDNLDHTFRKTQQWAPSKGEGGKWWEGENIIVRAFLTFVWFFYLNPYIRISQFLGRKSAWGLRRPGMYHREGFRTNEFIHASVQDRKLERVNLPLVNNKHWPCQSLYGWVAPQDQIKPLTAAKDEKFVKNDVDDYNALYSSKTNRNDPRNNAEREQEHTEEPKYWRKSVGGEVFTLRQTVPSEIELRCKNNIRSAAPETASSEMRFSRAYGRKIYENKFHDFGLSPEDAQDQDWHLEQKAIDAAECHHSPEYQAKQKSIHRHEQQAKDQRQIVIQRELGHKQELEEFQRREKEHQNQLGLDFSSKKGKKGKNEFNDYGHADHKAIEGVTA